MILEYFRIFYNLPQNNRQQIIRNELALVLIPLKVHPLNKQFLGLDPQSKRKKKQIN